MSKSTAVLLAGAANATQRGTYDALYIDDAAGTRANQVSGSASRSSEGLRDSQLNVGGINYVSVEVPRRGCNYQPLNRPCVSRLGLSVPKYCRRRFSRH